jgi:aminoglycoside phosphotransferase (APT) family kinase protein
VPQWADLPLSRLPSSGTDNALYRMGDRLVLRIPRRASAATSLSKELDWLPHLTGLPLSTPRLRYRGCVGLWNDCEFGILDWLEGEVATSGNVADAGDAASALAGFLKALHQCPTDGAPVAGPGNSNRGVPLTVLWDVTVAAIAMISDEIDASAARALWNAAIGKRYASAPVWLHGDLKADNLLAKGGQLSGVIDWGLAAVGDPAADYAAAWSWVDPSARDRFRELLELDDSDWLRARAWALYGAVIALSYYRDGRNESLTRQSRMTLSRLGLLL